MREMVLNHASLISPDRFTAVDWLKDMTGGMATLVHGGVTHAVLRARRTVHETKCFTNWSLFESCQALKIRVDGTSTCFSCG